MYTTAFLLGFMGSIHCVGMCSPLALAVSRINPKFLFGRYIYNFGRIITYCCFGAIVAFSGSFLGLPKFQNTVTFIFGIGLILAGIFGILSPKIPFLSSMMNVLTARLKQIFGQFLKAKNPLSMVLLGAVNGMLPCGLTYMAVSYCFILPDSLSGVFYMASFGIGTLPAMIGVTTVLNHVINLKKWNLNKLITSGIIILGCSLVARALFIHFNLPGHSHQNIIDCFGTPSSE